MRDVLFGTTLLVSFLSGTVALLAPCCVSVMLPAFLATGFRSRGRVMVATLAFAFGVATVILPIGMGAAAISAAISGHHLVVYLAMGIAMLAMGAAMGVGWRPKLPMPAGHSPRAATMSAAYLLGGFSGVASACCAPVLAGVVILAGAAGSFPAALTVGLVYVLGMVAPLLLIAVAWERGNQRWARVLQGRRIAIPATRHTLPIGDALAAVLLTAIGALTVALAITGPSMPTSGWRVELSATLQHWASLATARLSFVTGWVLIAIAVAGLARYAVLARRSATPTREDAQAPRHDLDHDRTDRQPATSDGEQR
jgi:cytochrome c-type biogenesis protein